MDDKILDSIDVWIGAQGWKSKLRLKSINNISLEGIDRLRSLFMELAVRGKLILQDPNDEPARMLLEKNAKKRTQLGELKGIRKQSPLREISDEETPFKLPQGWEWVRLGEIADIIRGVTYEKSDARVEQFENSIRLLRASNIDGRINLDDTLYIPRELIRDDQLIIKGDILIAMSSGSADLVGKAAQADKDLISSFGAFCGVIRSFSNEFLTYFGFYFQTPLYRGQASKYGKGIGINNLSKGSLENLVCPVPPLTEQYRIVAKVDELMKLCDELEHEETNHLKSHQLLVETLLGTRAQAKDPAEFQTAWTTLTQHFDDMFITEDSIDQLKQTILQLAVMGKLVLQDSNDEPASMLLERISREKSSIGAKIKKQKLLPEMKPSEKPFELPQGWLWCHFGKLGEFINGDRSSNYPNKSEYVDKGIAWINTGHIEPDGTLSINSMNYITEEKYDSLRGGKILPNDLVYCLRGATFGKTAFVKPYSKGAIASSLMIIRLSQHVNSRFVYYYLKSSFAKMQLERFDNGSAQPNLAANDVSLYSFPLPPFQTQTNIAVKIDQLFELCDRLKERITKSQKVVNEMADSILEQVV
jgi:type I restriction enzyme S subunit